MAAGVLIGLFALVLALYLILASAVGTTARYYISDDPAHHVARYYISKDSDKVMARYYISNEKPDRYYIS